MTTFSGVMTVVEALMCTLAPNPAPLPPPNAKTTATPAQVAPHVKTPTTVLFVRKTVPQVTKKQELLIRRAQPAPQVNFLAHGISTNANHGPNVPAASTSLPTAQAALIVYAAVAHPSSSPPTTMLMLAPAGQTV